MAGRRIGPFVLQEQIGAGGMGVVYRGIYTKNGKEVAVKMLPRELGSDAVLVKRFARELKVLQTLRHKNIVLCYGGGRSGGQHFYAMEYVRGGTLAELLKKKRKLPWERTIRFGVQICDALHEAHSQGVVHRDLKPANLFLTKEGTLKLGDFGLARLTGGTQYTAAGKTAGTFAYMAPEQISGKPAVSHKTDLYALGCVLFELLTGRPPFRGENSAEVLYKHLHEEPPRIASENLDCPVWLERVVRSLLAKKGEDRPFDALAVSVALQEVPQKVRERQSVVEHAASAGPTVIGIAGDTRAARKLLAKKKRKKKRRRVDAVFYEKTWFLLSMLAAVALALSWLMWPLNEEQLFARAAVLMETDDPGKWGSAYNEYLTVLQEDYPEGPHAEKVQEYVDKYQMHRTEEGIKRRTQFGREPTTEAERLYIEAWEYEKFGDRVTAFRKYEAMVNLLDETNVEERPYVNLARRKTSEIEAAGSGKPLQFVAEAMERAGELYQSGKVIEARKIWQSVVTLYASNEEVKPLVVEARGLLAGEGD